MKKKFKPFLISATFYPGLALVKIKVGENYAYEYRTENEFVIHLIHDITDGYKKLTGANYNKIKSKSTLLGKYKLLKNS